MNVLLMALIGLGLAFDVFAIAVSQGAVLGSVKARGIVLMCLMVCAWQIVALVLGYFLASLIKIDTLSHDVQRVWGITAAILFVILGAIKLMYIYYRKAKPEVLSDIDFKKTCSIASSTSIYTLFAGFACVLISLNITYVAIMVCCITVAIVIIGVFVGYRNGELDKRLYWAGGILLIIAGILVLLNQLGMTFL